MPVPRLFESPADPREQWMHVLASVLALANGPTRASLVEELAGEALPGADVGQVREFRPLAGGSVIADIVMIDSEKRWVLALQGTLAFDAHTTDELNAVSSALSGLGERVIVIAITPDRSPSAAVLAAGQHGDVRHKRWQRVRDWIQERPERGRAEGIDLLLLREADYVLNARTAELYRLEELMPLLPEPVRGAFATAYFDLDSRHTQPRVTGSGSEWVVAAPRTGDPLVEIGVGGGGLSVALHADGVGGGFTPGPRAGWETLAVTSSEDYSRARGAIQRAIGELLPARR